MNSPNFVLMIFLPGTKIETYVTTGWLKSRAIENLELKIFSTDATVCSTQLD